jgi:iron complex outermembrane receptor protein
MAAPKKTPAAHRMTPSVPASCSLLLCTLVGFLPQNSEAGNDGLSGAEFPELDSQGLAVSLGDEQFASINAVDVDDLVRFAPNLSTSKRFGGDDNGVVSLRGANGTQSARLLVMVDGFVVSNLLGNSERFSPKWDIVGPSEVERIDILYGPYSARYGGNSMGGVISVTTGVPAESGGYVKLQSLAMPFSQYGVDETFVGYGVEAGGTWKRPSSPWTIHVSGRHLENTGQPTTYYPLAPSIGPSVPVEGGFDDPRIATPVYGAISPTEIVQDQFRMRARYEFRSGWDIEGVFFGWLTDREQTDPRTFLADQAGEPVYEGRVNLDGNVYLASALKLAVASRSEFLAGMKTSGKLGDWDVRASLSRYWIDSDDTRISLNHSFGIANLSGTEVLQDDPGWWNVDAGLSRNFERHRFVLGFNANQYETREAVFDTENWRTATPAYFRSENFGRSLSAGVYAEDEFRLTPNSSATIGIRGDWWRAYDGGITQDTGIVSTDVYPEREHQSFSPKLSYQARLGEAWDVQLSLGAATRYPTVGELFQGRFNVTTRSIDPGSFDPDLKPERSRDANLLLRWAKRDLTLTSSVFYQEIDDSILLFPALNQFGVIVTNYKNIDSMRQYGIELIAEAENVLVDGLDFDANVARTDARTLRNSWDIASEGEEFPGVPDWRAGATLRYRASAYVSASLGWRYASRENSDLSGVSIGDTYGFLSGYSMIDARVSWKPRDSLEVNLGVDNLTDQKAYAVYPLAQRTAFAEFKIGF